MSVTVSLPLPNLLLPSPRGILNIHTPGLAGLLPRPLPHSPVYQSPGPTTDLICDRSITDSTQGKHNGAPGEFWGS